METRDAQFALLVLRRHVTEAEMAPLLQQMYAVNDEMYKKSRWAGRDDDEAETAKEMFNIPAYYRLLGDRFDKERARLILSQMTVPISFWKHWDYFLQISIEGEELDVAKRFVEYANREGVGKYTEHEIARSDDKCVHMRFTECLYDEVCKEAGYPELTQVFCDGDDAFFPVAFPGLKFHRGDSEKNTLGYGCDHCDLILEAR